MSPGEEVRNFYREQGRAEERKRIVDLLESKMDFQRKIGIFDYETGFQLEPHQILELIQGKK
jgi:hypothetical protein